MSETGSKAYFDSVDDLPVEGSLKKIVSGQFLAIQVNRNRVELCGRLERRFEGLYRRRPKKCKACSIYIFISGFDDRINLSPESGRRDIAVLITACHPRAGKTQSIEPHTGWILFLLRSRIPSRLSENKQTREVRDPLAIVVNRDLRFSAR